MVSMTMLLLILGTRCFELHDQQNSLFNHQLLISVQNLPIVNVVTIYRFSHISYSAQTTKPQTAGFLMNSYNFERELMILFFKLDPDIINIYLHAKNEPLGSTPKRYCVNTDRYAHSQT